MHRNFTLILNLPLLSIMFIALLIAYSLTLNATIRYVDKNGLNIPPYDSIQNAAWKIQDCINICVFGDTIYVATGVYQEQVVMIPGLSLIGAGMDSCIVNTQSLVNAIGFVAVTVKDSCLLTGFSIVVYYNNDKGYGIAQSGNSIVTRNRINNAAFGIYTGWTGNSLPLVYLNKIDHIQFGVYIYNSSPIIRKNNIYPAENNSATSVRGIFIEADNASYRPVIDSNYIETIDIGIEKNPGTRSTIRNNEIKLVNGSNGISLEFYGSDSAWVYSNLIYTEEAEYGIDNDVPYLACQNNFIIGNFSWYGIYLLSNNIVKNNVVMNAVRGVSSFGTQNLVFQYNNVWNNEVNYVGLIPDTTNLSADPMVVNDDSTLGDLDFHLQMYSPLIDAGDPNILDRDGSRSDIGLYGGPYGESYIYVDLPPRPPINLTANVDTLIKLNWNKNTEADFSYYNVYRDTAFNFTIDSTKLIATVTDTFYYHTFPSNVETLYYKLTAVDNQGNESNPSEQIAVILVTVRNEWKPVNNYILYQNYPNPFNPSTQISYKLKERGYVKLYVYDIKGELVSVLVNEVQESGYYEVEFNAAVSHSGEVRNLSSGVYIYQIFVSNERSIPVFSDIKKMVYVK